MWQRAVVSPGMQGESRSGQWSLISGVTGGSAENVGPGLGPGMVLSEPCPLGGAGWRWHRPHRACSGCCRIQTAQGLGGPRGDGLVSENWEEVKGLSGVEGVF